MNHHLGCPQVVYNLTGCGLKILILSGFGLTILIVSHDPEIARQVGRVVAIRDGKTATISLTRQSDGSLSILTTELLFERFIDAFMVTPLKKPALSGTCKLCAWYNSCRNWCEETKDLTILG